MSVREKCDETNWEDGSDYGTALPPFRGVPSEVVLNEEDGMKSACAVNLHNAVTVSQQSISITIRKTRGPA